LRVTAGPDVGPAAFSEDSMKHALHAMRKLAWVALCLATIATAATVAVAAADAPRPPQQPAQGPGGAAYAHGKVIAREVKDGAQGWWLFTPSDPVPRSAPVVVFCHGWGAMNPRTYRAWIDHLVRRGNIVVYPLYQDSLRTPPDTFLPNAIAALKDAFAELGSGAEAIRADLDRVAVVGHSAGGVLAAEIAAVGVARGLPTIRAAMPVEPGDGSRGGRHRATVPMLDLAPMPRDTLLLVVVGADDHLAGEALGLRVYDEARELPRSNRNVLELESDDHGTPALVANHAAPSATRVGLAQPPSPLRIRISRRLGGGESDLRNAGAVDAMDWYGTWKLLDALTDAAFYGTHRDIALGGSAAQTSMGTWSDGVAVKPMRVLR
jgi:acetyl esterase/lipase